MNRIELTMTASERFVRLADQPMVKIGGSTSGLSGTILSIREILAQREMLGLLVRRDLKARYKDSALGFVWTLIRPLTQLAIYYVVIGKFLQASKGIPDFAIYIYTGLVAYGLFSEIITSATGSIVANGGLIKKIYLPREIFPLASVGSALFNFVIQFAILVAATIVLGRIPWSPDLWFAIPSFAVLVVYATAFGFLLSAVNVYLRDVSYLVEVLLLIALWASPIVYSWSNAKALLGNSFLLEVYTDNPVTLAILGFRKAFWIGGNGVAEYPGVLGLRLAVAFLIGIVLLFIFQRVFARLQGNFAQEL